MLIRSRTDADVSACLAVMATVHEQDAYPMRWPHDPRRFLSPADVTSAWVAVSDDRIVGHVLLRSGQIERGEVPEVALPGQLGSVSRLFVDPAARGQGVAAGLLNACAQAAGERGMSLVLSVVDDGKAAIGMYEHLGWRHFADKEADWQLSDGSTAMLRYFREPI